MAPNPFRSPSVEFQQSEITKPQPLRIIKRSQTVTGCEDPREIVSRGRESSGSSNESRGSPTWGQFQKLTIHKKRRGRGSIFDVGDGSPDNNSESPISDLVRKYSDQDGSVFDPEITPKAPKQLPRTISAGNFLKSELHQRSSDIEAGMYSVRNNRHSIIPQSFITEYSVNTNSPRSSPPKVIERRPSKSKNFFLRAIGGRGRLGADPIERPNSKPTMRRRLSRSRSKNSSSSSEKSHSGSAASKSTNHSTAPETCDITDVGINSRISSYDPYASSPSSTSSVQKTIITHVLCPHIVVTPEVSSVNTTSCSLWVAIEISGILKKGDGMEDTVQETLPDQSRPAVQDPDSKRYGLIHSLSINLVPGAGCAISETIGNIHEMKTISQGQTRLIIAKIRLGKIVSSSRWTKENSADDLIAELDADLGNTVTPYLTIQLSYKHTGFPDCSTASSGLRDQTTQLRTEATAVILRHNPHSAWSPRSSQTIQPPLTRIANPLTCIIERRLLPDDARDALGIVAAPPTPIPFAKRYLNPPGSSEETIKPEMSNIASRFDFEPPTPTPHPTRPVLAFSATIDGRGQFSTEPSGAFARLGSKYLNRRSENGNGNAMVEEIDPARKIWTEMRQASRGGTTGGGAGDRRRYNRSSISMDHYLNFDGDATSEGTGTGSRGSSGQTFASTVSGSGSGLLNGMGDAGGAGGVEGVRERIMECALRNKRSVGADTLRSFAPSLNGLSLAQMGDSFGFKGRGGRGSGGSGNTSGGSNGSNGGGGGGVSGLGLGLGAGRSWAWGPGWW